MAENVDPYISLKEEIGFFGSSPQVEEVVRILKTVAPTELSVLIIGESGTGKELIARAIHKLSKRSDKPLIPVNTGAIPEGILESELFGHEKGSFTGAVGQKKGYFEAADTGTIFLDEIGEMALNTQVKLLRVLEESEFMRVGGTKTYKVDVRLIAATNKDLEKAVQNNEFRRDLYYRLKAITIHIPPLRKRKEDVPVLVKRFATAYAESQDIQFKGFSPDAIELMTRYEWPGNVRELRNFVETAVILNKGNIVTSDYIRQNLSFRQDKRVSKNLPVPMNMPHDQAEREIIYRTLLSLKMDINDIKQILVNLVDSNTQPSRYDIPFTEANVVNEKNSKEVQPTTLSGMEREMIKKTLQKYNGSRRKTARALQISERTLYRKINEYGL